MEKCEREREYERQFLDTSVSVTLLDPLSKLCQLLRWVVNENEFKGIFKIKEIVEWRHEITFEEKSFLTICCVNYQFLNL